MGEYCQNLKGVYLRHSWDNELGNKLEWKWHLKKVRTSFCFTFCAWVFCLFSPNPNECLVKTRKQRAAEVVTGRLNKPSFPPDIPRARLPHLGTASSRQFLLLCLSSPWAIDEYYCTAVCWWPAYQWWPPLENNIIFIPLIEVRWCNLLFAWIA